MSRKETDIEYARDAILLLRTEHDEAERKAHQTAEQIKVREKALARLEGTAPAPKLVVNPKLVVKSKAK